MKLDDIKVVKKYSPRKRLSSDIISKYKELYSIGEELPPITIQKEKKILVDGFHRFEAQKQLDREEVEVEILDIPEKEIYVKSIRMNRTHGNPFSTDDINNQIWRLYRDEEWTFSQIGKEVGLDGSTVSRRYKEMDFMNLGSQDTKKSHDKRRKDYDPNEVIKRFLGGERKIDIARDLGVSPATVTQITKNFDATPTEPVVILCYPWNWMFFIRASLGNMNNTSALVHFTPEGVYVNSDPSSIQTCTVACFFTPVYFPWYDVKESLIWELRSDLFDWGYLIGSKSNAMSFQFKYNGETFVCLTKNTGEGGSTFSHDSKCLGTRPKPRIFNMLDENGIWTDSESFPLLDFEGIPQSENTHIKLADKRLTLSGTTAKGWHYARTWDTECDITFDAEFNQLKLKKVNSITAMPNEVKVYARTAKDNRDYNCLFKTYCDDRFFATYIIREVKSVTT